MIHTSWAPSTNSSGSIATADSRLATTRNGRRGTRSTIVPNSGANSAGNVSQRKVRPAAPLDPVSVLTHMLITMSISESPTMLAVVAV